MKTLQRLSWFFRLLSAGLSAAYPLYLVQRDLASNDSSLIVILSFNTILIYVVGLEMHVLSNRNVANGMNALHVLNRIFRIEVIFIVFLFIVANFTNWGSKESIETWKLVLLLVGTLGFQELYRVLVVKQMILFASSLLLFKTIVPILLTQFFIISKFEKMAINSLYVLSVSILSLTCLGFGLITLSRDSIRQEERNGNCFSYKAILISGLLIFPHTMMLIILMQYEVIFLSRLQDQRTILWAGYQVTITSLLLLLQDVITIQPLQKHMYTIKQAHPLINIKSYCLKNAVWCLLGLSLQFLTFHLISDKFILELSASFILIQFVSMSLLIFYVAAFPIVLGMGLEKAFSLFSLVILAFVSCLYFFDISLDKLLLLKSVILCICFIFTTLFFIRRSDYFKFDF